MRPCGPANRRTETAPGTGVCVGVATGAARLAGMTGATVIPVYIRPERDLTHELGLCPASSRSTPGAARGDMQSALDYLVAHTVLTHPCPWEG
jgi:lauroyl/myristoyl acyltransferase